MAHRRSPPAGGNQVAQGGTNSMVDKTRTLRRTLVGALAVVLLLIVMSPAAVFAEHVDPVEVSGNPTCAELVEGEVGELRLEGNELQDGTYTDGTFTVTVNFSPDTGEPISMDFSAASPPVIAVFV